MSAVITPAILAENAAQYKEQVDRITGFAERVHIDISDGEFAPTLTVSIPELCRRGSWSWRWGWSWSWRGSSKRIAGSGKGG